MVGNVNAHLLTHSGAYRRPAHCQGPGFPLLNPPMARILYFAQLAEHVGKTSEDLALPAEVTDVRALLAVLRARGPQWQRALADDAVRVMVNRQLATLDTAIGDAQEIGLLSTLP